MNITAIIPTYNEYDNINQIIQALDQVRHQLTHHKFEVLFVDDSSPDGTAELIKKHQKAHPWIHLLLRPQKQGLGAAYAAGMRYAMAKLKADALIELDGDFQHDPRDIKRLVAEFDQGYDYVIASRYINGGSIPPGWELVRKLLSVAGNYVARALLFLPQIHDVTGGFKLTRVKGYGDHLHLDQLISQSFAYKIQLLHETVQLGAKVKEIPIQFAPRATGESKIIKNEIFETLRVILILQSRNPKIIQFFKFGIVGFIGYLVQAISLQIFSNLQFSELFIWGGSAELAIISNFTINNLWTFKHQKISGFGKLMTKFTHFNISSIGAIIIQIVAGRLLVSAFGPQYRQLYLPLIIAVLIIPYNYLMYTKFIWKTKNETNTTLS